jgi:wyosine [tRNA(Phe)-imidazoG37] synthetase (radical SAM superfamily)
MILDEDDRNIKVQAKTVGKIHFTYECPYCWRLRNGRISDSNFCKKTKRIYSSAKPNIHYHGSGGDFSNRTEHRISHCTINDKKSIYIEINDDTERKY